jgi:hypothetical protein
VLPHADPVFDGDVVADRDSALDESMIADVTVRAYNNVLQYVREGPNASAFANRIRFDQRFLVDEWCFHEVLVRISVELLRRIVKAGPRGPVDGG